ncbi:MAG: hypothetical protein J5637_07100 [Prevotella sp.]|nr:hypothetical protein [Prevotella sp.]
MNVLIVLNFTTAVAAFLTLVWKRHPIMALVALFCSLLYGYGLWHVGFNFKEPLAKMLLKEEGYGQEVAYLASMGGWTALMLSNVCMILFPWLRRWAVVLWGMMVLTVGLVMGMVSPLNIVEGLYAVCCAIMAEFALLLGKTYLETTVLGNIYLQSLFLPLCALPAFLVSVYGGRSKTAGRIGKYLPLTLSAMWLTLNVCVTVAVWWHYNNLSLQEVCRKCIVELQELSGHTWSGYVMVNILIFVVAFLIDLLISWLLYRYAKSRSKCLPFHQNGI